MAALAWLLGFVGIVYLGLKGGGYDPLVHDQVGIVVWWVLAGAVVVGALPRRRLGPFAWIALGLFALFLAWTVLSLLWTDSSQRTFEDVARIAGYFGFFSLAILGRSHLWVRKMVAAVGCGIVVIAAVALLSRLHPAWFSSATDQTAAFLPGVRERLSYPINYWNGLAGIIAIGIPLVLQMATDARLVAVRALAAAALPALILTIYLTLSRGGIGAAAVAVGLFYVLAPDRIPKLIVGAVGAVGGAILVAAESSRTALSEGFLNGTAEHQGNQVLLLTIVVCAIAGVVCLGIWMIGERYERPGWTRIAPRQAGIGLAAAVVVAVVIAVAVGVPGKAHNAVDEFTTNSQAVEGSSRLSSFGGENRWAIWSSAVREAQSKPLTGTGSGTFEYWWNRDGTVDESVVDTHSFYLQTLGELGWIGLAILAAFLAAVLGFAGVVISRAGPDRRTALAAAAAGFVAFLVAVIFDWLWQIPAIAVAALLLAAVLVVGDEPEEGDEISAADPGAPSSTAHAAPAAHAAPDTAAKPGWPLPVRAGVLVTAVVVVVAIAVPLASTSLERNSQSAAREGNLSKALGEAEAAASVEPFSASAHLQEALVLEEQGDLTGATAAARKATSEEKTNWRNWLVLSRVEARRGNVDASLAAYRRAKANNPRAAIFRTSAKSK